MSHDLLFGNSKRSWSRSGSPERTISSPLVPVVASAATMGFALPILAAGAAFYYLTRGKRSEDPFVWTKSAVKAELDRVRDVLDTVNQEASAAHAAKKINKEEWESWRRTYATAHRLVTRSSAYWGSNVPAARAHEQEALRWRELLKERKAKLVAPPDLGRPGAAPMGLLAASTPLLLGGLAAGIITYKLTNGFTLRRRD